MKRRFARTLFPTLLAAVAAGSIAPVSVEAIAADSAAPPARAPDPSAAAAWQAWRAREGVYFERNWGIDIIGVRPSASGLMLDFRYRVIDPKKAQPLGERSAKSYLVDEASGATFSVPAMENVGELRQTAKLQSDRSYYVIFGNPGRIVKTGSRVSVVIGPLRVDGLVVQ